RNGFGSTYSPNPVRTVSVRTTQHPGVAYDFSYGADGRLDYVRDHHSGQTWTLQSTTPGTVRINGANGVETQTVQIGTWTDGNGQPFRGTMDVLGDRIRFVEMTPPQEHWQRAIREVHFLPGREQRFTPDPNAAHAFLEREHNRFMARPYAEPPSSARQRLTF